MMALIAIILLSSIAVSALAMTTAVVAPNTSPATYKGGLYNISFTVDGATYVRSDDKKLANYKNGVCLFTRM